MEDVTVIDEIRDTGENCESDDLCLHARVTIFVCIWKEGWSQQVAAIEGVVVDFLACSDTQGMNGTAGGSCA